MQKKRKEILAYCVLSFVFILTVCGCTPIPDYHAEEVELLTKTCPTLIVTYGEPVDYKEGFYWKAANALSDEELEYTDHEYKIKLLGINDADGTLEMSDDDWTYVFDKIENHGWSLCYVGKKYFGIIGERFGFGASDEDSSCIVENYLDIIQGINVSSSWLGGVPEGSQVGASEIHSAAVDIAKEYLRFS